MIEGILCVDKPLGLTSHDVVSRVRRLANIRKVGHGGTLDPLATGLLIVAVGRATRMLEYVLGQTKEYQALVRLGQTSSTYDAEGELIDHDAEPVAETDIRQGLMRFRGEIWQTPPMYSAVKKQGKPLYELARQGIEVAREARQVTIYELELLTFEPPDVTLHVRCSSGTYIRSLAHDLGQALGTGGYLAGLRRTAIGHFGEEDATPLQMMTADDLPNLLHPMESAVAHLSAIVLSQADARALSQGQSVPGGGQQAVDSPVRVFDEADAFVGIAALEDERWRPLKIFYNG